MQRYKGAKKAKKVAQSKHIIAGSREWCVLSIPTSRGYVSQAVTSKKSIRGTDATTQASGPKDRRAQAHGKQKAWQSLDLDRKIRR